MEVLTVWPEARSGDNEDADSMIAEIGSRGSASPASNATGVDDSSRSSVAGDDPLDEEGELDAMSVGSNSSDALSEEPDLGTFSAYSTELENRVNELDQRVSEIQRRFNERLRVLCTDRCRNNPCGRRLNQLQAMTQQRRRDRLLRMRAHLQGIRARYAARPPETRQDRERKSNYFNSKELPS
jgi:hypothetical protein